MKNLEVKQLGAKHPFVGADAPLCLHVCSNVPLPAYSYRASGPLAASKRARNPKTATQTTVRVCKLKVPSKRAKNMERFTNLRVILAQGPC